MIPFINLGLQKQKLYILPDGANYEEIYATLESDTDKVYVVKMDLATTATHIEMEMTTPITNFHYSYHTDVFLSAGDELIYSKITTVSPYYIFLNETKHTIIIEQSEMQLEIKDERVPVILEPGTRLPF